MPKPVTKTIESTKAEMKTIPTLKTTETSAPKSVPAKQHEPMYTKAAAPKVNKVRVKDTKP